MKNSLLFYFISLVIIVGISTYSLAQVPPSQDPNFELNFAKSDEFEGNSLNPIKWWAYYGQPHGIPCFMYPEYVSVEGGYLKLKSDQQDPSGYIDDKFNFSAGIESYNTFFTGYYEISAKLPGFYHSTGIENGGIGTETGEPSNRGFWTTFWTYYTETFNDPCSEHDELDILEPSGLPDYNEDNARTNEVGDWQYMYECNGNEKLGRYIVTDLPILFEGFHTFGVEYTFERLIYYFDDTPFHISLNQAYYPGHDMFVVIASQLQLKELFWSDTPWPLFFTVDYFRFYDLKQDCNLDVEINSQGAFDLFYFSLKRNISINSPSAPITLTSDKNITFRARNSITIEKNFETQNGSTLYLIPTQCY